MEVGRNGLQSKLSEDSMHPNKIGYNIMEQLIPLL